MKKRKPCRIARAFRRLDERAKHVTGSGIEAFAFYAGWAAGYRAAQRDAKRKAVKRGK